MNYWMLVKTIGDTTLFIACLVILFASILLSFKMRFIQFRAIPFMIRALFDFILGRNKTKEGSQTILAHKALFTAMSTTIGISSIVSPVIAIRLGGPGALLGFFLAMIFGSAANFTEVTLALSYRKRRPDGTIMGGPMQYLREGFGEFWAQWYAFFGLILLTVWSAGQANQLADILGSPLLGSWAISAQTSGICIAVLILFILFGGIKRIGNVSEKMVPFMFLLYTSASIWVILANYQQLPAIFDLILRTAFSREAFVGGIAVGGLQQALRWGIFKGVQSNEAGVGTATIPHSMAETHSPTQQGMLAMASIYSGGFICILSGLVVLLTGTWEDSRISLGINVITQSFAAYFSYIGIIIVVISSFLFAFGTILGNSYNGSQCFTYLTQNRWLKLYYLVIALSIFYGSISDVRFIWTIVDYFLVPVALPHIIAIVILAFRRTDLFHRILDN